MVGRALASLWRFFGQLFVETADYSAWDDITHDERGRPYDDQRRDRHRPQHPTDNDTIDF